MTIYIDCSNQVMEGPDGTFPFIETPPAGRSVLVIDYKLDGTSWWENENFDGRHAASAGDVDLWRARYNAAVAAAQVPPPPPTIEEQRAVMALTRWQLKAQLRVEGTLDAANSAIDALADPVVSDWWHGSGQEIKRLSPTLESLAIGQLGYTPETLDQVFIAGRELEL